jgi:6-pyruvoyltetrahydropterin/6-carboxytetrahydropterin synthase
MAPERSVAITRVYHFSAAHRLANKALSDEANDSLYGPCARNHGHNYYLEVTVTGAPHPLTGMAVDLGRLDATVHRVVLDEVDHAQLEDAPALAGVITTGESLARAFWRVLAPAMDGARLSRVGVVETAKNRFEYRGEDA